MADGIERFGCRCYDTAVEQTVLGPVLPFKVNMGGHRLVAKLYLLSLRGRAPVSIAGP